VYALGIVLYEALTGAVPFQADSVEELARLHQETLPQSPRELNPRVPASLEGITLKAMAKVPAARFANANELASALKDFNGGFEREAGDQSRSTRMVMDSAVVDQQNLEPVLPATEISSKAGDHPESQGVQRAGRDWLGFDLVTWLLALLALIFVGGLIPFWLWVYFFLYPPG
jgi:serine/threonine-protein kinase